MKRMLAWLLFVIAAAAQGAALDTPTQPIPELKPAQQQAQAAHLAAELLTRFHYKSVRLDDELSSKIFDNYLKTLDAERVIFVQSDIDRMAGLRTRIDDAILAENLTGPFAVFNLYMRRAIERFTYARSLLGAGFDFKLAESFQVERDKEAWPASDAEVQDLWRKRVKNDWLRLRLAGKDDKGIAETLDKRYASTLRRLRQMKGEDAFMMFMNAYTTAIEPHTNYLAPRAAADFNISMQLALVGIGAVLEEKDDYTTIRELVPGGPAAQSGQLKVGDRILGVAQGANGEMTDVMGWRLDETVALIRGTADSVVVLDVLPADANPDGAHKRVTMVRKKIALEDQAAKKSVRTISDGPDVRRVGIITLPSFYEDFAGRREGSPDYKSASRDVARLLEELKKDRIDSLLIDLRNNGGGSLKEAVELTGLFIDKGPVVQQRNSTGAITVERDTRAGMAWAGPLAVLIDRTSASASEIFAAAIQDYGRGVIIGEPSFGKGTVQTLVDLDQMAGNDKPKFGELKMTVAQFFRINGGTTQLRGVTPDIALPSTVDAASFGESSYSNALPWVQISPADFAPSNALKNRLPQLQARHNARLKTDRDFQFLLEDIAEFDQLRRRNRISLNEAERRKERDAQEARAKLRESLKEGQAKATTSPGGRSRAARAGSNEADDGLQASERPLASQLVLEAERKNSRDIFLDEAVQILGDESRLLAGQPLQQLVVRGGQNAHPTPAERPLSAK